MMLTGVLLTRILAALIACVKLFALPPQCPGGGMAFG